jgi:uncharacterized caspase-like protein
MRGLVVRRLLVMLLAIALVMSGAAANAHAERRIALLIGNQGYNAKVGALKNPHNDITLVGAALERLRFQTTLIEDADYKAIDTALKLHIQQVRNAGKDAISFVYYSGHGAANPDNNINYLIPVDVKTAEDADLWIGSFELTDIIDKLRNQTPNATHYVVFDACRDELQLTQGGKKAPGAAKGFVPVANTSGVMVVYATAPGRTASDLGQSSGPYAKALVEEIVKPGVEAVTMFRNVQLKVKQAIGQDPWLSFPSLPEVYFAGSKPAGPTPEQQAEMTLWASVKDSTDPAVLASYLKRYPNGEYASVTCALIDHYEQLLNVERTSREEVRRREEEATKAAEVKRLEEQLRASEAAVAQERRRAEEAKSEAEMRRLEYQQKQEEAKNALGAHAN